MPRLLLVRHLKPLIESGICYGASDVPAEQSQTSHERLIKALSVYNLDKNTKIYTSPLTRCVQLSKTLRQTFHFNELNICAELAELNFGDWEMQKWDDIDRSQIDAWANDLMAFQFPNGESALIMRSRIKRWLSVLPKHDCVVVCHGGTIRQMLSILEHTPMSELLKRSIGFGEVISVDNIKFKSE
jgi:alpha-ribazole phosphatase